MRRSFVPPFPPRIGKVDVDSGGTGVGQVARQNDPGVGPQDADIAQGAFLQPPCSPAGFLEVVFDSQKVGAWGSHSRVHEEQPAPAANLNLDRVVVPKQIDEVERRRRNVRERQKIRSQVSDGRHAIGGIRSLRVPVFRFPPSWGGEGQGGGEELWDARPHPDLPPRGGREKAAGRSRRSRRSLPIQGCTPDRPTEGRGQRPMRFGIR